MFLVIVANENKKTHFVPCIFLVSLGFQDQQNRTNAADLSYNARVS